MIHTRKGQACPIAGCNERCEGIQIMCHRHWYSVPAAIRQSVWIQPDGFPYHPVTGNHAAHREAAAVAVSAAQQTASPEAGL